MLLEQASFASDPIQLFRVPLSSWVLGYPFGEWATGVTTTLYRVLPDGSTEQIAQTTFAFYHIPDVEELEVTTAPLTKLYAGDTAVVHVAGIGPLYQSGSAARIDQQHHVRPVVERGPELRSRRGGRRATAWGPPFCSAIPEAARGWWAWRRRIPEGPQHAWSLCKVTTLQKQ